MMKDDDFKLSRGFGDVQTFVIVELLLRLKNIASSTESAAKYKYETLLYCMFLLDGW